MAAPQTCDEFLNLVRMSGVIEPERLDRQVAELRRAGIFPVHTDIGRLAGLLVRDGLLTHFQAEMFLMGKWRRFSIGHYEVLERVGSGTQASVYLCRHTRFKRLPLASKVLPAARTAEPVHFERFYREARALAALNHVHVVRAYDIDRDDTLHFLVMDYVDGSSLHHIVREHGPVGWQRAAHYMRQAALGLQHIHEAGIVHRDIEPGNLVLDRDGAVRIIDLGMCRFVGETGPLEQAEVFPDKWKRTKNFIAPEQERDFHNADIRADLYGLGATFHFLLSGREPRQHFLTGEVSPETPQELVAIADKLLARDPADRFQSPAELAEALARWTQTPIAAPAEKEMPRHCPAVARLLGK